MHYIQYSGNIMHRAKMLDKNKIILYTFHSISRFYFFTKDVFIMEIDIAISLKAFAYM